MASSGEVLLNEAKSEANTVKSVENLTRSAPAKPADLPNTAKVVAASKACCFDCPRLVAVVAAKASICFALSPKISPALAMVSDRSLAAIIASLPYFTANAAPAAVAAIAASLTLSKALDKPPLAPVTC
jgi:hypothetical protein